MSGFLRRLSSFVLLCAMLAQAANSGPAASAQGTPDGSGCWPAGALTGIAGGEMMWSSAPQTIIDPAQQYQAKLQTTAGDILIQLDPVNAPIATNNFICLVLAGYYLGTDFHRIIANTLIQGGDPTGTGTGSPGYTIPSDPTMGSYPVGSVAMANSGPDQNGAQFFIAVSDLTMVIPGSYPVFGQVIGGMDIVAAISNAPATPNLAGEQSKPVEPNTILTVQVLTGTNSGVSQGPILSAPAPTPIVHAAPAVTPESTQATESTWGRPGGSASSDAPAVEPGSCAGFDVYQEAFDDAYANALVANTDAFVILLMFQDQDDTTNIFEEMTPEEAEAISRFYGSFATELSTIAPPPFAAEWHALQIEIYQALSEFSANIASQGMMFASIQAATLLGDLSDRSTAAEAAASAACADFATWASGDES